MDTQPLRQHHPAILKTIPRGNRVFVRRRENYLFAWNLREFCLPGIRRDSAGGMENTWDEKRNQKLAVDIEERVVVPWRVPSHTHNRQTSHNWSTTDRVLRESFLHGVLLRVYYCYLIRVIVKCESSGQDGPENCSPVNTYPIFWGSKTEMVKSY